MDQLWEISHRRIGNLLEVKVLGIVVPRPEEIKPDALSVSEMVRDEYMRLLPEFDWQNNRLEIVGIIWQIDDEEIIGKMTPADIKRLQGQTVVALIYYLPLPKDVNFDRRGAEQLLRDFLAENKKGG